MAEVGSRRAQRVTKDVFVTLKSALELAGKRFFFEFGKDGLFEFGVIWDSKLGRHRLDVGSIPNKSIRVKQYFPLQLFDWLVVHPEESKENGVACSYCGATYVDVNGVTVHWSRGGSQCQEEKAVVLITDQFVCQRKLDEKCKYHSIRKADMELHRCQPVRTCPLFVPR